MLRERARIADALHDDVLQRAASARQDLLDLQRAGAPSELLDGALRSVSETIDAIRSVLGANHDLLLSNVPLGEAVGRVAEDAARRGRLRLELDVEGASAMESHATLIVSAVRELSENVVRHARASRLRVSAVSAERLQSITVEDDGVGMPSSDMGTCAASHVGLRRLELQLWQAGGQLFVGSSPDAGTRVELKLPSRDSPDQRAADQMARAIRALREAGVAWSIVRRDGSYAFVDDRASDLIGYSREDIQSHVVTDAPWSIHASRLHANLNAAEQLGKSTFLTSLLTRDGQRIEVTCTIHAITQGGDPAFLAITRPVHDA